MTLLKQDRLYHLLPELYRRMDESGDRPLKALMAVLESEYNRLEGDIGAMYDDWFIETCDMWVVPYIADLIGVRNLQDMAQFPNQRRLVANSLAYRRRKGTLPVIEQVVRDATGWYAHCVEFARLRANTQDVVYSQPESGRTVNVRTLQSEVKFDRSPDNQPRTFNLDNSSPDPYGTDCVGISLYRLRSYPVRRAFAFALDLELSRFTFDPFGRDMPIFNQPKPVMHASQRVQPVNLPIPITRTELEADLDAFRLHYGQMRENEQPPDSLYFGPDRSFYIELPGQTVRPSAVLSMDLSQWPDPPTLPGNVAVGVDTELGRIALADPKHLPEQEHIQLEYCTFHLEHRPTFVIVNYNYGFSSEMGGGPYHRKLAQNDPDGVLFEINVATSEPNAASAKPIPEADDDTWIGQECVSTLGEALARWENQDKSRGIIRILDNGDYDQEFTISLPAGTDLTILADSGVRPILGIDQQPIKILCTAAMKPDGDPRNNRRLHLNGLFLRGGVQIEVEEQGRLDITVKHCTLASLEGGNLKPAKVQSDPSLQGLDLDIERCILGPLYLPAEKNRLRIKESIIDNGKGYAIASGSDGTSPGPEISLDCVTIFGKVRARQIEAAKVIFRDPLTAPSSAIIQHSYVPKGSTTLDGKNPPWICKKIKAPTFTSTDYGAPGYGQLSLDCHPMIRCTTDGSEMGAFHDLHTLLSEQHLQMVLQEYLPVGVQVQLRYVT